VLAVLSTCHHPVLCSYIHQKPGGGVHEYLCNKLVELPDMSIERILSQLCELASRGSNASGALQRALVVLSRRSLRLAVRVWIRSSLLISRRECQVKKWNIVLGPSNENYLSRTTLGTKAQGHVTTHCPASIYYCAQCNFRVHNLASRRTRLPHSLSTVQTVSVSMFVEKPIEGRRICC
jgi:hypothetical protein